MKDNMELFLQFTTNDLFNKWLSSTVFNELEKKYAKWLSKDELYSVEWLPADVGLIDDILKEIKG